jgi:hypothetical protein
MLYCPNCGIHIHGNKSCCPLCGGELTGTPEESVFPAAKKNSLTGKSIIRISVFVLMVTEIGFFAGSYLASHEMNHSLPWIPLVMIGAAVIWLDLILAIRIRNNTVKLMTAEAYFGMIVSYVTDRLTGFRGWSVSWMIPMTFLGLAAATIAIGIAVKMRLEDYIVYLLVDALLCLLQIIPIASGGNPSEWAAVICIAVYLVLASAALLFRKRELRNAARKYFNV